MGMSIFPGILYLNRYAVPESDPGWSYRSAHVPTEQTATVGDSSCYTSSDRDLRRPSSSVSEPNASSSATEYASVERTGMSASGLRVCLPEGTAPGRAKASNQWSALDPGRTDISVLEFICQDPAWQEYSLHVYGHTHRAFFACFGAVVQ